MIQNDDTISRQAAIDAMINSRSNADVTLVPGSYTNGWIDGRKVLLDELLQVVLELPSAQPEHDENPCQEQGDSDKFGVKTGETCEDCISRQAAIDALREAENHAFNAFYKGLVKAHKIIVGLPPAQPERKKGRWLNINESEKWECSECGRMMWFLPRLDVKPSDYRFCPNCGADMREGQDAVN